MSQRQRGVEGARGERLREDASLKAGATGGITREEIQRTLVETMEGILSGRIEPKEAYAIGRLCKLQLKLLGYMEQLDRQMGRERKLKQGKGKKPWVN